MLLTENEVNKVHQLEVIRRLPHNGRGKRPPLLFVHGAFTHAGCWDEHFMPWFAERGWRCHALSLRGHGKSKGAELLDAAGLDDYVEDLARVAATLAEPPVLIGHSMGAILVQRYLRCYPSQGAVLMAPVPPTGMASTALGLMFTQPMLFMEITRASRGIYSPLTLKVMRDAYFSPELPEKKLLRYVDYFQRESERAIMELTMLGWFQPTHFTGLPVMVLGGEHDAIFPPETLRSTARLFKTQSLALPDLAHVMMLDRNWESAAASIHAWLDEHVRGPVAI
jgi:non-heme chloroperoxidase